MGPDEMETRGLCIYDEKRALIRLKPGEGESTLDTLLEEWAHVLRAECPLPQDDDHDAVFWAIYQLMSRKWRGE